MIRELTNTKRDVFLKKVVNELNDCVSRKLDNILYSNGFIRLTSGTVREVFLNNKYNLICKMSKGKKGIAQNYNEIQLSQDYYIKGSVNDVIQYIEFNNKSFLFTENLKVLTKKEFREYFNVKNTNDILEIIGYFYQDLVNYNKYISEPDTELYKSYDNNSLEESNTKLYDFLSNIRDIIANFELCDLNRLNSYGLNKDNELIIIDYGCNRNILKEHYNR